MDDLQFNIDALFAPLVGVGPVALAVSGGGDSMALLYLFARWRAGERAYNDVVLTVDHGLRAEAAIETQQVMDAATSLRFEARALVLDGFSDGDGLQSRARRARYEAMALAMAEFGITHLLTAHTLDDQAETFLMRLKRGSGVDGLSAILPQRNLFGVTIVRPLLEVRGADLRDFLKDEGVSWVEDPSNRNEKFERVRVRKWLFELDDNGELAKGIGDSTRRLQNSRLAIEAMVDGFLNSQAFAHLYGVMELPLLAFEALSFEIQIRVLRRMVLAFGRDEPLLSSLEAWIGHILAMGHEKFAIAGVMVEKSALSGGVLLFSREAGRTSLEELVYQPGELTALCASPSPDKASISDRVALVWDGRVGFEFSYQDYERVAGAEALTIRGFLPDEIAQLRAVIKDLPERALTFDEKLLVGIAGFWCVGRLLAVPQLEHGEEQWLKSCFGVGEDEVKPADNQPFAALEINAKFPLNPSHAS